MKSSSLLGFSIFGSSKSQEKTPDESTQSPSPTLGFLNRAHVCAVLSQKVYAASAEALRFSATSDPTSEVDNRHFPNSAMKDKQLQVKLDSKSPPFPDFFSADYVDSYIFPGTDLGKGTSGAVAAAYKFCTERNFYPWQMKDLDAVAGWLREPKYIDVAAPLKSAPDPREFQYSIWYVHDLGYVAAYKGSSFLEDWMANFLITDVQLEPDAPFSNIRVHEGISSRAMGAWQGVATAIKKHAESNKQLSKDGQGRLVIPVLLTGESLTITATGATEPSLSVPAPSGAFAP